MSVYTCLTSGEWRNLCSAGRIRLHTSRVVGDPEHATQGSHHKLFALAPDRFTIGESADLLVAEVSDIRVQVEGAEPDAHCDGMGWLVLEDVIAFSPVRADDAWAFEADAERAQVRLSEPRFDGLWHSWTKAERHRQACINGAGLSRLLALQDDGATGPEGMEWSDVALLAIDPKDSNPRFAGLTANVLLKRDALFNLVRADSDFSAIFVSCPVEWANILAGANVLEGEPELEGRANWLHERFSRIPFDVSTAANPDLACFVQDLALKVPAAFSDDWRPATVTLYARYIHRLRFGKPTPDEVVDAVKAAEALDGRRPARLLAFLLGMALDSNRNHTLARLLQPERFSVAAQASPAKSDKAPMDAVPAEAVASGHTDERPLTLDAADVDQAPAVRDDRERPVAPP